MQEPLCTTKVQLECVNNINVGTNGCLKPCSGLYVTGYTKSAVRNNLEDVLPMYEEYNQYKKATQVPSGYNAGKYVTFPL